MNKKEIFKSILIIVGLGIVIGGLIVYKKQINKDIEDIDLGNTEELLDNDITEEDKEEVKADDKYLTNITNPTIDTDTKFSESLALGSTAMNSKDYMKALEYFNKALTYKNSDLVYARIFSVYSAKGEWASALTTIDKAISLNPSYTDYWNSKLVLLDDKMTTSFEGLKAVYEQGLTKVDNRTKVNLITSFARIAENNQKIDESIKAFTYAKEIYPENASIYQTEIDRLKTLK